MPQPHTGLELPQPTRRRFLQTAILGGGLWGTGSLCSATHAAGPPQRPGTPYMKLSLAGYSFNRILPRRPNKEQAAKAEMTLADFVRFCAELNLDGCEPTAYYFPKEVTRDDLLHLKNLAFRLGLDISGTAIGNDFSQPDDKSRDAELAMTRRWIDYASILGAPVIRIFAGRVRKGDTEEKAFQRSVTAINESLDYAAEKGVFLALENHGGLTSTPEKMLKIVQAVKDSPWFGVNFDSGNFHSDDPYRDLAQIAPYAVNAQIKVHVHRKGRREEADLERIIGILKDAGYRGYVVLEYEGGANPKQAIPPYINRLRELLTA